MRKTLCGFLVLIILSFNYVFASAEVPKDKYSKPPFVNARSAIAIDSKNKVILFKQNSNEVIPMASTTKIITSLVALKYGNLDKKVEISSRAAGIRGSTVGYRKGEQITIKELLYGLMLRSGNDAAIAIAEGISGSVDEYLKLMNEYAVEIGLINSHFESPHGLDSQNHYTTAYDLALATSKAREIKEFRDIVGIKDVDKETFGFSRSFHNINKILWEIPEATGVKTGYTGQAGKCLVTSINYENNDIIIVVLNSTERWKETKRIFDYIKNQYEYKQVAKKDEIYAADSFEKKPKKVTLISKDDYFIPIKKTSTIKTKLVIPKKIITKVHDGDKFGKIEVYENENIISSIPLYYKETAKQKEKKWFDFFEK